MSEQQKSTEETALTPEELRQQMLDQLDASKQMVTELSDDQLEDVAGGFTFKSLFHDIKTVIAGSSGDGRDLRSLGSTLRR